MPPPLFRSKTMQNSQNSLSGASTTATATDGIDRIKELLNSAIDTTYSHTNLVGNAINRIAGHRPKEAHPSAPQPPISERSIYQLLGDLESAQRALSEELTRIREQLP